MPLRTAAHTDIGRIRENNEDSLLFNQSLGLYGVADGVGGLPFGAEASSKAVESITQFIAASPESVPDLPEMVRTVNEEVVKLAHELSPVNGIATTLCMGCLRGDTLHLVHIGDSRAYLLRDSRLKQLTMDHNVETEAKQRMARGESVRFNERNRAALTRCIGQWTTPVPDIFTQDLKPGDRVIFLTDGIFRLVAESEIEQALELASSAEEIVTELVALANRRGGIDNASAVVVMVD